MNCNNCGCVISGVIGTSGDTVFYSDEQGTKIQHAVCLECDAEIQWVRNPPFPPLTKNQLLYLHGSLK